MLVGQAALDAIEQRRKEDAKKEVWLYAVINGRWVAKGTGVRALEAEYNKRGLLVTYFPHPGLAQYHTRYR